MLIQSTKPLQPGDVCRADGYIFAVPGADEAWMNCGEPLNHVPQTSWRVTGDPGLWRGLLPGVRYTVSGTWDGEALADNGRLWVCSVQDPTRANELDLVVRLLSDAPASGSVSAHSLQWQFTASGDLTEGDHPPITVGVRLGPRRSVDPSRVAVLVGHEGERFGWDD